MNLEEIKAKYLAAQSVREQSLATGAAYRLLNAKDYKEFVEWQKVNSKKLSKYI